MGYIVVLSRKCGIAIYLTRFIVDLVKLDLRFIARGGCELNTKEAVAMHILQLCQEREIAMNALATLSGVFPSTVCSMLNEKRQNPGVVSIKKNCDGLGISLREFFDCELFGDIEQEIK